MAYEERNEALFKQVASSMMDCYGFRCQGLWLGKEQEDFLKRLGGAGEGEFSAAASALFQALSGPPR